MARTTPEQLELVVATDDLQQALESFSDDLIAYPSPEIALRHQPNLAVSFAKLMCLINHQKGPHAQLAPTAPAAAGEHNPDA